MKTVPKQNLDILPQYEVVGKDTINCIDKNGLKQGRWISYEKARSNVNIEVTHTANSIADKQNVSFSGKVKTEEGFYKDDKKTGYWKNFSGDGSVKDSVEFR